MILMSNLVRFDQEQFLELEELVGNANTFLSPLTSLPRAHTQNLVLILQSRRLRLEQMVKLFPNLRRESRSRRVFTIHQSVQSVRDFEL